MAGPRTTNETRDICGYAADVTGRCLGLSKAETYITDPTKRALLAEVAGKIQAKNQALFNVHINNITFAILTHKQNVGEGRAIDRAFDRHVAHCAETIRTGPSGGSRDNDEYRAVFNEGTAPFQSPTIRDDAELATELGTRLDKLHDFPQKQSLVADNAKLAALIEPAAAAVVNGEKKTSTDFTTEVEARQALVDELWNAKKTIEMAFRRNRGLIKFVFFDFRKDGGGNDEPDAGTTPPDAGTPEGGNEPKPS